MVDGGVEAQPDALEDLDPVEEGAAEDDSEGTAPSSLRRAVGWMGSHLPAVVFGAAVAATVPLVLFHYGKDQWFLRDEWFVLTDQEGIPPLFKPNAGAHWILVPRLVYWAFWKVWGVTTYRPYAIANLVAHLTAIAMLRVILRRSGVMGWMATAAAGLMLLFGPGHQGILLAFQIGFTGSLAWGLVQLVLADHEGGFDWRDIAAFGFGLLAITSSGIGITTTIMVGLALLLRRSWKAAAVQSLPLLGLYALWMALSDAESTTLRPTLGMLVRWVRETVEATVQLMFHFDALAIFFVLTVCVAAYLVLGPKRDLSWSELRRQWAMPLAMFVAMLSFAVLTGMGRAAFGIRVAYSSRYIYLQAILLVPLFAVAAQTLCRRWRHLTPVFVVLFLLPIPFNLKAFDDLGFDKNYYQRRRHILTTAPRMPFADDVPRSVRPVPDAFDSERLTIGFLLDAVEDGKLEPSTTPLDPHVVNEFRVRLGFAQSKPDPGHFPGRCETTDGFQDVAPAKGDSFIISQPITVTTIDRVGGRPTTFPVGFNTSQNGSKFTAELPDLRLRIKPFGPERPLTVCSYE